MRVKSDRRRRSPHPGVRSRARPDAPRLPGRPAGANGDRTRARILDSAVDVFARDGLAGASLRDIAQRARIRVSTLYHYFPSKEALYQEVQDGVNSHIRELTVAVLGRGLDLRETASEVIGALFDFFLAHRAYVRLGYRMCLEGGTWLENDQRVAARWLGLAEGMLKPAEIRGVVKRVDPVLFLVTVDALLHWHVVNDGVYRRLFGRGLGDREIAARVRAHVVEVSLRTLGID